MSIVAALLVPMASAVAYLDYSAERSTFLCKRADSKTDDFRLVFWGSNKAMTFEVEPVRGGKWPKERFSIVHPVRAIQLVGEDWKTNPAQVFRVTTGPLGHPTHLKNLNKFDLTFDMRIEQDSRTNKQRMASTELSFFPGPEGYVLNKAALFSGTCRDPDAKIPDGMGQR